jgi:hypothetical protein
VPPLTAPFLAAAVLVAAAGALKLRRPADTAQALRTQGLPGTAPVVRLLGLAELVVAGLALAGLAAGAVALAVLYAAFSGFVLLALLRGRPLSSCGCFGAPDTPPSWWHVAVTASAALCCALVAAGPAAGLPEVVAAGAGPLLAALSGAVVVGALAFAVIAELPPVLAAAARPSAAPAAPHPAVFQISPRSAAP